MEHVLQALLEYLGDGQETVGVAVLFVCAVGEYVFPPFPGDTVTLFGAFLCAAANWSVPLVFAAVTAGSVCGTALDYWMGKKLTERPVHKLSGLRLKTRTAVAPIIGHFEQYGILYILINRFLPGIRALFFVAAGMSGLPFWRVMGFGALSAAIFNGAVMAAGFWVGSNWVQLVEIFKRYTLITWSLIFFIILLVLIIRRSKR